MSTNSEDDQPGFMESLDGIRRLQHDKVDLYQQKPRQNPNRRRLEQNTDDAQRSVLSEDFTSPVTESYYQPGLSRKLQKIIRNGGLEIEDAIDLHGYRQPQARSKLLAFLDHALHQELRFVLIIHGKGFRSEDEARLKPLSFRLLAQHPAVLAWCPASPKHGGSGASYVYLRKNL